MAKRSFFGILILMAITRPAFAKPSLINIVYDLNGVTMTDNLPTPGFGEQLQIQLRDPRVRIHFFSTQPLAGIRRQLARVKLPDGRTAEGIGRLIDGSAMNDFDAAGRATFKDLRAITHDPTELANTILVDDSEFKAHPKQTANLLWLPIDIGFREEAVPPAAPVARPAKTPKLMARLLGRTSPPPVVTPAPATRTRRVNRRSDLMLGLIQAAINVADTSHCTVSEALYHLQWGRSADQKFDPSTYRLDAPRTQAALIRYGARVRKRHGCAELLAPRRSSKKKR